MCEEWTDIKDYEGLYQVSNFGRVRSLDRLDGSNHRLKGRILKPIKQTHGYLHVCLYKNGSQSIKKIHRLVAQAFISNPENKLDVNHIDENKTNNMLSNLEWVTRKENVNHGTRNERAGKSNSIAIIATNIKTGESTEFYGSNECARQFGLSQGNIAKVLKGRLKQTGGYTFKYKEVEL